MLIYVQKIAAGNEIFYDLFTYCSEHGLISETTKTKPFAFLHAQLNEETKATILSQTENKSIKILISTSASGK